jgi:hypothetical protein
MIHPTTHAIPIASTMAKTISARAADGRCVDDEGLMI